MNLLYDPPEYDVEFTLDDLRDAGVNPFALTALRVWSYDFLKETPEITTRQTDLGGGVIDICLVASFRSNRNAVLFRKFWTADDD